MRRRYPAREKGAVCPWRECRPILPIFPARASKKLCHLPPVRFSGTYRKKRYNSCMFREYDPSSVEAKWRQKWADAHVFDFDLAKAKDPFYLLVMFPYPSGARLHVGHWFQYSIPDSYGRFLRMKGK